MKKLKCENCLIQVTCTKICTDFAFQVIHIDHEIKCNEKRVFSNKKRRRKRLKTKDLVHYNTLINKFNKSIKLRESIWDRQFMKLGLSKSSSGGSSSPSISSMSEQVSKISLSEYWNTFYGDRKSDIIKIKADLCISRSYRRWFRKV
jgi:hypothetical protein